MTKTIDPRVEKLPAWAQELIRDLAREREAAIRALREFEDAQEETAVSYWQSPCLGEDETSGPDFLRRYLKTDRIEIDWKGVNLTLRLQEEDVSHREGILIRFSQRRLTEDVAIVATGRNEISIEVPEAAKRAAKRRGS